MTIGNPVSTLFHVEISLELCCVLQAKPNFNFELVELEHINSLYKLF